MQKKEAVLMPQHPHSSPRHLRAWSALRIALVLLVFFVPGLILMGGPAELPDLTSYDRLWELPVRAPGGLCPELEMDLDPWVLRSDPADIASAFLRRLGVAPAGREKARCLPSIVRGKLTCPIPMFKKSPGYFIFW